MAPKERTAFRSGFLGVDSLGFSTLTVVVEATDVDHAKALETLAARFLTLGAPDLAQATRAAQDELDALILFKGDMGAFLRLYTFLSQIFDYGNSALEKRAIFYKRLLPLLEFGREREGIDLSKMVLTRHKLLHKGK